MKRYISLVLIIAMVFVLCACSSSGKSKQMYGEWTYNEFTNVNNGYIKKFVFQPDGTVIRSDSWVINGGYDSAKQKTGSWWLEDDGTLKVSFNGSVSSYTVDFSKKIFKNNSGEVFRKTS